MRRRLVYYLSGFDPRGARFYHQLYREQAALQQGVDGWQYDVGRRTRSGEHHTCWSITATQADTTVHTLYAFCGWDDLIRSHWGGSDARVLASLPGFYWRLGVDKVLSRSARCAKRVTASLLAPLLALLLSLLLAALVGGIGLWLGTSLAASDGVAAVVALAGGALTLAACAVLARRLRLSWLMRIHLFLLAWGRGGPEPFDSRWASFADRIERDLAEQPAEEVLVVGHSVGAVAALAVVDDWLRRHGAHSPHRGRLKLLTLGQVFTMVGFIPEADWLRRQLRRVGESGIPWLDCTAPTDPLCYALVDPFAACGLPTPPAAHYRIRSARFDQMFQAADHAALQRDAFRIHFQYLMASRLPVWNSYFQLTAGSRPLEVWL